MQNPQKQTAARFKARNYPNRYRDENLAAAQAKRARKALKLPGALFKCA